VVVHSLNAHASQASGQQTSSATTSPFLLVFWIPLNAPQTGSSVPSETGVGVEGDWFRKGSSKASGKNAACAEGCGEQHQRTTKSVKQCRGCGWPWRNSQHQVVKTASWSGGQGHGGKDSGPTRV